MGLTPRTPHHYDEGFCNHEYTNPFKIMACNCIKTLPESLVDLLNQNEDKPEGFKVLDSKWEHILIYPQKSLYVNFLVRSTFQKKDGKESKPRTESYMVPFHFCPFCGNKYEDG